MKIKNMKKTFLLIKVIIILRLSFSEENLLFKSSNYGFFSQKNMYYLDFYDLEGPIDHKEMFFK